MLTVIIISSYLFSPVSSPGVPPNEVLLTRLLVLAVAHQAHQVVHKIVRLPLLGEDPTRVCHELFSDDHAAG